MKNAAGERRKIKKVQNSVPTGKQPPRNSFCTFWREVMEENTRWIAVKFGDTTVLINVENEESVSWLKEEHGTGMTREDAVKDLKWRLSHEE